MVPRESLPKGFKCLISTGSNIKAARIATIIEKEVKIPKNTLGLKFELTKIINPNTIVKEV